LVTKIRTGLGGVFFAGAAACAVWTLVTSQRIYEFSALGAAAGNLIGWLLGWLLPLLLLGLGAWIFPRRARRR
jgi:hypothetical protein